MSAMHTFNLITLALAFELQEGFPRVERVNFKSLRLLEKLDEQTRADCGEKFDDAVDWLQSEGFIDYSSATLDCNYFMVRLTEKGVQRLLNEMPHGVGEPAKTVGSALDDLRSNGIGSITDRLVGAIVGAFIGTGVSS